MMDKKERAFEERMNSVEAAWQRYLYHTGRPPTMQELCELTGFRSVSSPWRYVQHLLAEGRIKAESIRGAIARLHSENRTLRQEADMRERAAR